jgi:hypothetical protein
MDNVEFHLGAHEVRETLRRSHKNLSLIALGVDLQIRRLWEFSKTSSNRATRTDSTRITAAWVSNLAAASRCGRIELNIDDWLTLISAVPS